MSTDGDTDNVNQKLLQPLEGPLSHVLDYGLFLSLLRALAFVLVRFEQQKLSLHPATLISENNSLIGQLFWCVAAEFRSFPADFRSCPTEFRSFTGKQTGQIMPNQSFRSLHSAPRKI